MKRIHGQLRQAGRKGIHGEVLWGRYLDFGNGMLVYRRPDRTAVGLVRERKNEARSYFARNL